MLNELKRIAIFNKVVECGSFTMAGESLGLAKSKVSEQITSLESTLNVRLLHRTTRKINLTTEGITFYQYSSGLLKVAEEAFSSINHLASEVCGTIRIGTTIDVGSFVLTPLLSKFSEQYPNVVFDIQLDDGVQDPVEANLDIVLRIGELTASSLVGRVLAPFELGVYASQDYLSKAPPIRQLQDIKKHNWVCLTRSNLPNDILPLTNGSGDIHRVKTHPKHICNAPLGSMSMVQQGMGIGLIANFLVEEVNDPTLVRLFPDFYQKGPTMNILYPSRKNLAPRVRLFIDYLIEKIQPQ
ncbi:putative LysR family transcriptional regulator [Vibrio nigripulchritudo SOn1]|uniref:LysR family transcriptional regulator n=1 Tax=Vibrio nigripulchritudo SOn1 TaxID=1238450 RepID=A0AAV2VIA3_9VIBR|nr:LysR family transcriptional regulator [Vibrio nigripulchritudo]CCO44397.1 putative LysR family transcriptional regulator [Vibrio nigripulchritudo SOn1]